VRVSSSPNQQEQYHLCMNRLCLVALLSATVLLPLAGVAHGCSCTLGETRFCGLVADYPAIFAGRVTSIKKGGGRLEIHFAVDEAFKGSLPKEPIVYTPADTAACGYPFQMGEKYLVYAGTVGGLLRVAPDDALTVLLCGDTHPFSGSRSGELEYLRNLARGRRTGSICGTLSHTRVYDQPKPLRGIKIVAISGGKKFSVRTSRRGAFAIKRVPEGDYQLSALLPSELTLDQESDSKVEVVAHGCSASDLKAVNNGSISGRVMGADGQPVKGVPVAAWGDSDFSSSTDSDGKFAIHGVAAGEYKVGVNIGYSYPTASAPYPQTYYPATREWTEAPKITVGSGTHLTGIEITLPPPRPCRPSHLKLCMRTERWRPMHILQGKFVIPYPWCRIFELTRMDEPHLSSYAEWVMTLKATLQTTSCWRPVLPTSDLAQKSCLTTCESS
jgi:hypothetical protein